MNNLSIYLLKFLRKLYAILFSVKVLKPECEKDPDEASQIIYNALMDNKSCMIARFGANELTTLINYLSIKSNSKSVVRYIKGNQFDWWWNEGIITQMNEVAGFFPPTHDKIEQFCRLMLEDMEQVDVLGSWLGNEMYFNDNFDYIKVHLRLLEPYWSNCPWSQVLQNKNVLVVHPFDKLIEEQYSKNRKNLFENNNVLPEFNLQTLKAVQSNGGEDCDFKDWFEALQWMKDEIDKRDYDICLIGCGAYGFHLAAHVKRSGKKAVHLGGALQLLFGIKGNRWDDPTYGIKDNFVNNKNYLGLFNESWVYPNKSYYVKDIGQVENGAYW